MTEVRFHDDDDDDLGASIMLHVLTEDQGVLARYYKRRMLVFQKECILFDLTRGGAMLAESNG